MSKVIKVCINPHCEEIAHNCNEKETRCRSCNMLLVKINNETYQKKFINNSFQYDYETGELTTPLKMGFTIQLKLL